MTVQAREAPARGTAEVADGPSRRDRLYDEAVATHGPALARLARAYEADGELCRDLQQDIHVALWRSLETFDERCSLRTWVYRVAHNVACTHVVRAKRGVGLVSLDELELPAQADDEAHADRRIALERLLKLIHRLAPLERQVILLYLEGMDNGAIAEITGLSSANLNTKVHRIKKILADRFREGGV